MAKLRTIRSTLAPSRSSLGFGSAEEGKKAWDAARDRNVEYRKWYKTKRWKDLAERVFVRDMYVCQKTGELLTGKAPAPNSPVAHHKIAHRGDPRLFWDADNVETVSKQWHDTVGQAEEATERCINPDV